MGAIITGLAAVKRNGRFSNNMLMFDRQTGDVNRGRLCATRRTLKSRLSICAHDRIINVARTIADTEGAQIIDLTHIAEGV